jgi:eukaryotic-like serine/threonine-protein kinase
MLIGTPAYLAPERIAGQPVTAASDLYSLGIVCFECLTGAAPFTGTSVEIALAHSHGQLPPLPPHVPAEVAAKDPRARPATATDAARWAARLRDAQAGPWPAQRAPVRRGLRRDRRVALAAGAVVIIAGLAGWLLAGGSGAAQPPRQQASRPRVSASPTAPSLAEVSQAGLVGQPVSAVRRQLRQVGLRVQVTWRFSGHQQPGTVISVQPTGRLSAGTTVVLTGALVPPGHRGGRGGGDDQGGGQGD